jgi:YNFM family putative membrane transporter
MPVLRCCDMFNRNQIIIVYCTIIAFAILYEHQPLLPLLAEQWGRSISDTALLTTITMLPLALAPLVYGYFLERFSSRSMLIGGFALLLVSQALLSTGPDYRLFMLLRGIEGLLLPAVFTSLMTYTSALGGIEHARRNISLYIASTIVGGYCGRSVTGFVTSLSDWQTAFWLWSLLALIGLIALTRLESDPRSSLVKVTAAEVRALIARPNNRLGLMTAFVLFFVFAGMLNFLPFRILEIDPATSTGALSMVYTGYLVGVLISVFSHRLVIRLGGERRTLLAGAFIYLVGTAIFISEHKQIVFIAMFVFAAGMFTLHSVLSGYLNHIEHNRKGLINGLYVSSYYSGGALGSFAPGLVYQATGWGGFIALMLVLTLLCGALILAMPKQ